MKKETKLTAETLVEKPMWMHIGLFYFKVRPLTLSQIWEIGSVLEDIDDLDFTDIEASVVTEMMRHVELIAPCIDMIIVILFRKKWKRWLFKRYIKNHLTMSHYKEIIKFAIISFQAGFFLTSFTFLKGAKTVTNRTNTSEATHRGDSWEAL